MTESSWPTQRYRIAIDDLTIEIETIADLDAALDRCAADTADDVDLIPYYCRLWPSSLALARYLRREAPDLNGCRVVELGCGLALPSLVTAAMGARVVATDFHPDTAAHVRRNIALNQAGRMTFQPLRWDADPLDLEPCDLVIGSDLLYEPRHIPPLVDCALRLCVPGGRVILADPGRDHLQACVSLFEQRGASCATHVLDDVFVLELTTPHRNAAGRSL